MVKNSQTQTSAVTSGAKKTTYRSMAGRIVFRLSLLGVFGTGIWYLYQNPQILNLPTHTADIQTLQQQINHLENRIQFLAEAENNSVLAKDINALRRKTEQTAKDLNKKIEKISDINTEILDSKASNANMLGVIARIDALETKINSLGKVSTQNALILTATGLVKDTVESGRPFEYEAEVLRQLTIGTNLQQAAETIAYYAADGIKSREDLINEFNLLYEAKAENKQPSEETVLQKNTESSANWKEILNSKLSKLVVVEYRNGNPVTSSLPEDRIYELVNNGDFRQAATLMADCPEYQSEAFKIWQKRVAVKEEVFRAIKKIQALTLAAIKVENLTEGNNRIPASPQKGNLK